MKESSVTQEIVLGGGCFWCVEAVFEATDGVVEAVSGYAQGHVENPTYQQVCTGRTGHAEVVRVRFDTARISLGEILDLFWRAHDPTTLNRQGADVGPQYRSGVYYSDPAHLPIIQEALQRAQKSWPAPIVTEVEPLKKFYPAEDYHQDYFAKNPYAGYCVAIIRPKLRKLGLDR